MGKLFFYSDQVSASPGNKRLDDLLFADDEFKKAVYHYSKTTGTTVYAGNDGDGIIVEGEDIQMIGNIVKING